MWYRLKQYNVVLIVAALLLAADASSAASLPRQLPSAAEIIERHVDAVGGRVAIRAHSSTHVAGTIEFMGLGLAGQWAIYGAAPNLTVVTLSFPDVGIESRTGYNGEVGWSVESLVGERVLEGGELQQLVDDADFYFDLHEPAKFSSMETLEMSLG